MVKKRGLGKTLDALLVGSSSNIEEMDASTEQSKEKLCYLPVSQIQRGKYQPRRDMNPDSLDELTKSIRAQGVIQPIVVRHILGGRYEIVAGERRWRAAQLAGLTDIPAIIKDVPDETAGAIALIENIQREELNPIEEAIALQRLLMEFSMTHQQVADAVGKSRTSVTNLLRLLSLTEEVKTMLERSDIEMGHARALLALSDVLQLETAKTIINKGLSVRQAEDLVRQLQQPKLSVAPKHIDSNVERIQQDLTSLLKLPVAIQHHPKGKGKLVIRYKNQAELDTLLEYFQ
jgi:ParB family chromosome partitioning protein